MREILFRGKSADSGEWVYGSFVPDLLEALEGMDGLDGFIQPYGRTKEERLLVKVERDTVGQFTGLTDKNGVRVFEGDIIHDNFYNNYGAVIFGDYASPTSDLFTHNIGFYIEWAKSKNFARKDLGFFIIEAPSSAVCGNIYDNPELLNAAPSPAMDTE